MNEQIKELVEQAGIEITFWNIDDLEKFAELIMRECAYLIDNKEMITAPQTYDEVFVAKYDTKEQCSKQILEHFEVEE